MDSFTIKKRRSLHFCGWMLRKRVCPEGTRKNLAIEKDEDKEREKKKDGAWMGKRILFLVGDSNENSVFLLSFLPSLSFSFNFSLPLSFVFTSSMSSLFTSIISDRRDVGYVQSANTLTSVTDVSLCRSRAHCQHRHEKIIHFYNLCGWFGKEWRLI